MGRYKCETCEDDGYIEVMDPEHYGAVIGIAPCPRGCEPKAALTTDMRDAGYDEEDYAYDGG